MRSIIDSVVTSNEVYIMHIVMLAFFIIYSLACFTCRLNRISEKCATEFIALINFLGLCFDVIVFAFEKKSVDKNNSPHPMFCFWVKSNHLMFLLGPIEILTGKLHRHLFAVLKTRNLLPKRVH